MQLYVVSCHVVSAELAVAMAAPIDNPADSEVGGIIRFLQADEMLGYLAEEASSRVELFCCTTVHVHILPEQFHWNIVEHPPYSPDLAPSDFLLFPRMKDYRAGKRFVNDEDLKDAG